MKLVLLSTGALTGLAPMQNPADTAAASAHREMAWRHTHHGRGWRIGGAIIWLAIVVYGLILATRFVRAVEKFADRSQGPR